MNVDFRGDFRKIIEQILALNRVATDPTEHDGDAIYRFFANARRRLVVQPYRIVEAVGLVCHADLAAGYAELKSELTQGIDVTDRLSRKTPDAIYEDPLLNDWGITHFHLNVRDAKGAIVGTSVILFALVRGDVVHCIGFYPHGAWASIEPLEIVQRNWPELVEHARARAVTAYAWSDEQRATLRKAGGQILNCVNGVVYGPVGGGYTTAGTSARAHWETDRALISVERYETFVRDNIDSIVRDFQTAGLRVGVPPTFHFGFHEDGRAMATEAASGASFILGPFPI